MRSTASFIALSLCLRTLGQGDTCRFVVRGEWSTYTQWRRGADAPAHAGAGRKVCITFYNLSTLGDSKLDCSASSRANTTKLGQDTARGYSCDMLESQEHPTAGSYRIFRFWDGLRRRTVGRPVAPVGHLSLRRLTVPL